MLCSATCSTRPARALLAAPAAAAAASARCRPPRAGPSARTVSRDRCRWSRRRRGRGSRRRRAGPAAERGRRRSVPAGVEHAPLGRRVGSPAQRQRPPVRRRPLGRAATPARCRLSRSSVGDQHRDLRARPRARPRAPSPAAVTARSHGDPIGACTRAAIPCSAANARTARPAPSGTGDPGSPTASAAFARPVKPPAARSRHAPSGRSTGAGQASAHRCSRRATAAQRRPPRRGRRDPPAPPPPRCRATRTGPRRVCTTQRAVAVGGQLADGVAEQTARAPGARSATRCPQRDPEQRPEPIVAVGCPRGHRPR